ncbi:MAG: hypothetical protein ACRC57_10535 [Sarcina sp.]
MRIDTGKFIFIAAIILIVFQWFSNFKNLKKDTSVDYVKFGCLKL